MVNNAELPTYLGPLYREQRCGMTQQRSSSAEKQ